MRTLVVEDEPKVAGFLRQGLEEEGWDVTVAEDGVKAISIIDSDYFDVIILDIMLPGLDGLSVLREIREEGNDTPVLLLTARDTVPDRVRGLRSGADDYLIKPFAFEELLARLQALLRRRSGQLGIILKLADLEMDTSRHIVRRGGQYIDLTPSEYRLLELLLKNRGHVLSRLWIEEEIWGLNEEHETNVVDVYINRLRNKIDKPFGSSLIRTVRGFGYKLEADNET